MRGLVDDVAAQLRFERDARRQRFTYARECDGRRLRYRFPIDVPVHDHERLVTVEFNVARSPARPVAHIDGPRCLRHRYADDSLCMWLDTDPPGKRWLTEEGLLELVRHVEVHAYCEAECRAGHSWPKPESPGRHLRSPACPTCHGRCSRR